MPQRLANGLTGASGSATAALGLAAAAAAAAFFCFRSCCTLMRGLAVDEGVRRGLRRGCDPPPPPPDGVRPPREDMAVRLPTLQ